MSHEHLVLEYHCVPWAKIHQLTKEKSSGTNCKENRVVILDNQARNLRDKKDL